MSDRARGQDTRQRIIEEACKVFGEKGYRDATHVEICRRAGANVAAINYYFGSKETLYRAVFERLAEKADALYPLHGGVLPDAPPEERLHAFIRALLRRMFDPERLGHLHRIRMAEMFDPTGLLAEPLERRLAQDRKHILSILRELLGPDAPQRDLEWCEMSIVGQCFMGAPGPNDEGPRVVFGLEAKDVDRLAQHVLVFSLAGVQAIRGEINERTEPAESASRTNTNRSETHYDESQH